MKLFSTKEIKKKKHDSFNKEAKLGLELAKELGKNLKNIEQIKRDIIIIRKEYDEEKTKADIKKKTLLEEISNLEAVRSQEMIPVVELRQKAVVVLKNAKKHELELSESLEECYTKEEVLQDQIDLFGSKWSEVREEEERVSKKLIQLRKEEIRILNKNKAVTEAIKDLNKKNIEFEEGYKVKTSTLNLEQAEVMARWKAMEVREDELDKKRERLQVQEERLAKHYKTLKDKGLID